MLPHSLLYFENINTKIVVKIFKKIYNIINSAPPYGNIWTLHQRWAALMGDVNNSVIIDDARYKKGGDVHERKNWY